jgi:alpha-D-xyloside xylohydrolase
VHPNSVIPIGSRTDRPDYDYSDDVTLQVYQLDNERLVQIEIPRLDGKIETTFTVLREGNMIHVQRQGLSKSWNVFLMGMTNVRNVEEAKFQISNGSTLIKANPQTNELKIQLS